MFRSNWLVFGESLILMHTNLYQHTRELFDILCIVDFNLAVVNHFRNGTGVLLVDLAAY